MTYFNSPPAATKVAAAISTDLPALPVGAGHSLLALRKSLFWRIHFWAALIASPFALIAALTGMLYIFTPQIEAALYDRLDHVVPSGVRRPLDEAITAAQMAAPMGWTLQSAQPAYTARDTVRVSFTPSAAKQSEHDGHHHDAAKTNSKDESKSDLKTTDSARRSSFGLPAQAIVVYVNPYTTEVVGTLAHQDRFSSWAKKLHSRLLQNDNWRWMIELAASWLMVMLLTGIYLWWPRKSGGNGASSRAGSMQKALPQAGAKGRVAWKQWHAFVGVALSIVSFTMLTTGLTWSKYAGGQIRELRDAIGQAPPAVPKNLLSLMQADSVPLSWQTVWETVRNRAPDIAVQLTPPNSQQDSWRAANADRSQPDKRFDLVLDAYSGQTLYYAGWDKQTAFSKATAIGIPFHRGEFGWINQLLLLIFGLGIVFSLVSGWVMFFKRRQPGSWGFPRLLPGAWKSAPLAGWITAVVLCAMMPLLAVSVVIVGLMEWRMGSAAYFSQKVR